MDCTQARGQIAAYLDDELEADAAAGVALHLLSCAACGAQAERMQAMHQALRQHGTRYTAPPALRRSVQQALRAEAAPRPRWRMAWLAWGSAGLASAACAGLLMVLALQPSQDDRLDQDLVASHYRALMSDRLADVATSD
ncbi:MAG: zf-HC2 domain-containing protein, partial [Pseudomonadota bacterium]